MSTTIPLALCLIVSSAAGPAASADPASADPASADPGSADSAAAAAGSAIEDDSTEALIDAVSIHETKIEVVPASEAKKTPPVVDDIVTANVPLLRSEPSAVLNPFLGRAVRPSVAASFHTAFVRETFEKDTGESGVPHGNMALASRVNLNLWIADLRLPASTSDLDEPMEMTLKIPFSVGAHHFAPMFTVSMPIDGGFDRAVYEAGLGYHGAIGALSLKLEVSGFNGDFDRRRGEKAAGMIGWNGALTYLLTDHLGVIAEVDGVTAISERVGITLPQSGDTVVRFVPGLRWFPKEETRFFVGAAGLFTFAPDAYSDLLRRRGALLQVGYTFL